MFVQIRALNFSSPNEHRSFVKMCAASENSLSTGTEVAGTQRMSLAIAAKIGNSL